MDYLVTMTTHVPAGTPAASVDDVRAREATRSAQLANLGNLVRLWRPPLQPGEWRSIGLFAAPDYAELNEVLASMPLHVWRADKITPLGPHPNDPAAGPAAGRAQQPAAAGSTGASEFLTVFTINVPAGTPDQQVRDADAREANRARDLAEQGHLERLWTLSAEPGASRALGLWRAQDEAEMQAILTSLPLDPWMKVQTTPLSQHPSDPPLSMGG